MKIIDSAVIDATIALFQPKNNRILNESDAYEIISRWQGVINIAYKYLEYKSQ